MPDRTGRTDDDRTSHTRSNSGSNGAGETHRADRSLWRSPQEDHSTAPSGRAHLGKDRGLCPRCPRDGRGKVHCRRNSVSDCRAEKTARQRRGTNSGGRSACFLSDLLKQLISLLHMEFDDLQLRICAEIFDHHGSSHTHDISVVSRIASECSADRRRQKSWHNSEQ